MKRTRLPVPSSDLLCYWLRWERVLSAEGRARRSPIRRPRRRRLPAAKPAAKTARSPVPNRFARSHPVVSRAPQARSHRRLAGSPPHRRATGRAMAAVVVEQLTRLGQVFEAYHKQKGRYPDRSMFAGGLSWRTGLLPYLGMNCSSRWTETNPGTIRRTKILPPTPDIFQPAAPRDGKASLVLMTGTETAYPTGLAALNDDQCPDGWESTILVVEVADAFAVPWLAPQTTNSNGRPSMTRCSAGIRIAATRCSAAARGSGEFPPRSLTSTCSP